MTPAQSRAARGLLNWSQEQLANAAQVGLSTVRNFEAGRSTPVTNNLLAIVRVLEGQGVKFTEHGVEYPPPRRLGAGAALLMGTTVEEQEAKRQEWERITGTKTPE